MSYLTENDFENALIDIFTNHLGYTYIDPTEIDRVKTKSYYEDEIKSSLRKLNNVNQKALDEAFYKITNFDTKDTLEINQQFNDYIQNGVEVTYNEDGKTKYDIIKLIDFEDIEKNSFIVINQWTIKGEKIKRPDIVLFINGLPLVVMELKSIAVENSIHEAYNQIRNYYHDIPNLFYYNAFCVLSDLVTTKFGTVTSNENRYMDWNFKNDEGCSYEDIFKEIFQKNIFLDIIKNFILFSNESVKPIKILGGYHQYYGVKKAIHSTCIAIEDKGKNRGKAGTFWHTQGSGKSLSMVFYVKLITQKLDSPTILVLTDRNDLDNQLYTQFAKCSKFLRQSPIQAEDRTHLKDLLEERQANGIIFTTIQKFEKYDECLSSRDNIILIVDEAHRSQYGLDEKINSKGEVQFGYARLIRNALPNATFIGFTGTPLSDDLTRDTFGDYIDIYDMTQSIKDGATVPIYYENRIIHLKINNEVLDEIDKKYNELELTEDNELIEKSKKSLAKMETIFSDDNVIDSLCNDLIKHYEDNRSVVTTGKAMIVAYSRKVAIKIFKKILEIKKDWKDGFIEVVVTSNNKDPEEWHNIINRKTKENLERDFKDDESNFKIAIVVDMWLTGFDVPSLATMYIYKRMEQHNLMQGIARVNRVYEEKDAGLVVDYIGIGNSLKIALSNYTKRDKSNYSNMDIANTALDKCKDQLSICRDFFHGFEYSNFKEITELERIKMIRDGADFISVSDDNKKEYIEQCTLLKKAQTLCRSILEETERMEFAFFEAVRIILTKIQNSKKLSVYEINKQINEFLKYVIKAEPIFNIFEEDTKQKHILDESFLNNIANMQQKNLALDMLKKLLDEQISIYERTNLVKSEDFSKKMKILMNKYKNAQLTSAEVIQEILNMANEIKNNDNEAKKLGLTEEEKAFYDALTKPENIKDFYENKELIAIVKELTQTLKKNKKTDWKCKVQERARMKLIIRDLLKKYDYPPDSQPEANDIVFRQCQNWVDNQVY